MGLSRNSFILNLITWLLFLSRCHGGQSLKEGQGFIVITVSKTGIDYVKDVMTSHALEALKDLHIPDMERVVSVPMLGKVFAEMTNFSVIGIGVPSSSVNLDNSGVNIVAKHIDVNCSMNWHYECSSWIFPFGIDDKGTAQVKVKRMEVGITFQLNEQNGSLNFVTVECGVFLQNLFINLDGGASWIYQAFINAFEDRVRAAIETAITKNIMGSVTKLNTLLQNLPRVMKIDDHAAWNVTVMQAPEISPATVCVSLEGLIVDSTSSNALSLPTYKPEPILSWRDSSKMLGILLSEAVLYSAARVYANAGMLNWVVDKLPQQSVLNTASWKYVIPQLYNRYPDDDMKLNISVTSPPVISLTMDGIEASVVSDLVIEVVDSNKIIPVLCISMTVNGGGAISISGNNVIGNADVGKLSLQLKWSSIGKLHMRLIEMIAIKIGFLLKRMSRSIMNGPERVGLRSSLLHSVMFEFNLRLGPIQEITLKTKSAQVPDMRVFDDVVSKDCCARKKSCQRPAKDFQCANFGELGVSC